MGLDPVRSYCVQVASVIVIGAPRTATKISASRTTPVARSTIMIFMPGRMVLPHDRRQAPFELPEQIAEAAVAITCRVNGAILFPEHHQIDAGPLEFAGEQPNLAGRASGTRA